MEKERYDSFDGLRAVAAIGILLMHYLANINIETRTTLSDAGMLYSTIIPFFTMFVYMFFIISAFSMCCGYFNTFSMHDGKSAFNTDRFYLKRYCRIWPFFATLVVIDFVMKPSWAEFYQCFADLTLAFNLLPNPHIDAIGVGWFLGVVFLFYMIFPWFVFLLQRKGRAWLALAVAIIFHVVLVRYFLTTEFCTEDQISAPRHNMVYSFPFFMVGGLLYLYRAELSKPKLRLWWLLLAIASAILQFYHAPKVFGENVLYIFFIFIFWVLYGMSGGFSIKGFKFLDNKLMKFLSNISMEIYLCHMVMFRLIEKFHIDSFIDNSYLYYWTFCLIGILLAIGFSWTVKYKVFGWLGTHVSWLSFLK